MRSFNFLLKKGRVPLIVGIALAGIAQPSYSRGMESEASGGSLEKGGAVQSAPSFREADKNGDHYVTKEELQDYPNLLKRFDEVDAGKTGRLEEHEYGNLVMEKSREKGR
jgi:hypothetical protein